MNLRNPKLLNKYNDLEAINRKGSEPQNVVAGRAEEITWSSPLTLEMGKLRPRAGKWLSWVTQLVRAERGLEPGLSKLFIQMKDTYTLKFVVTEIFLNEPIFFL